MGDELGVSEHRGRTHVRKVRRRGKVGENETEGGKELAVDKTASKSVMESSESVSDTDLIDGVGGDTTTQASHLT